METPQGARVQILVGDVQYLFSGVRLQNHPPDRLLGHDVTGNQRALGAMDLEARARVADCK